MAVMITPQGSKNYTPEELNVFISSSSAGSPAPLVPKSQPGTATQRVQNFLRGLEAPTGGTPVSVSAQQASQIGAPKVQTLDLRGLLLPGVTQAFTSNSNAQGASATIGDPELSAEVENLRLRVEKDNLERERLFQNLRKQTEIGRGYTVASVARTMRLQPQDLPKVGLPANYFEQAAAQDKQAALQLRERLTGANRFGEQVAGTRLLASPFTPTSTFTPDIRFSSGWQWNKPKQGPLSFDRYY